MKRTLIILGICCFIFTTKTNCQVTTNAYEVEIDKLLAEKNPDYYSGLKKTLSEFQNELISKGLIANASYQSFLKLLKQISEDDKLNFEIEYDLKGTLEGLGDGISKIMPSMESTLIARKYLNIKNSKGFTFNQKVSELVYNGQKLNPSKIANLIIEVYDQDDFELLLIKLKIFRFIDPNSNWSYSVYAGRPRPE